MDKSVLIFYAIPSFFSIDNNRIHIWSNRQKYTYRINDTFVSISIGLMSRFPVILNLGFNVFPFYISGYNLQSKTASIRQVG